MNKYLLVLAILGAALLPAAAFADTSGTMCYDLYQPVCASHQVQCFAAPCYPVYETYTNSCFATADNATIIHDGACTAAETGPIKPTPAPYVPPAGCIAWFDGCNSCGETSGSGKICTEMACVGPAKAGYCTAYASTTPPVVTPPVVATSTATTSPVIHHSFFYRFWHWLFHWK